MAAISAVEMRTSRHSVEKNREADPVVAENSLLKRYGPLMNLVDLASMPRGAAQAELTEGAERSLEFARK